MNRFEELAHTGRREQGELSVERIGELWAQSQAELLGDSVEITDGYRTWWSYIPHFINTPGYVYAYAYGQLLALAVYERYEQQGPDFVPRYLELLAAGGSTQPRGAGRDRRSGPHRPGLLGRGLDLVERQLELAEVAARAALGSTAGHMVTGVARTSSPAGSPVDKVVVIARALLALTVTLTLAAVATIAPSVAAAQPLNYMALAEQGEHQSEAWRSGDWYCEYLHCTANTRC